MTLRKPMAPGVQKRGPRKRALSSKRLKPRSGNQWWIDNQAKNLDALSSCLAADLESSLPPREDVCGDWSPATSSSAAAKQLSISLLKKYEWETCQAAEQAALEKFLAVNNECKEWKLDTSELSEEDTILLGEFKNTLYRVFNQKRFPGPFDFVEKILDVAKVGPGSSLEARGTGFYTKLFSSQLTCTSAGLYRLYSNYIEKHPDWSEAEYIRNDQYGEPLIVPGNKMCFVPKNVDIARVICVEPSLNMYFQLGVKHTLEELIKAYFHIDFSVQQGKNRALAQLASMFDNQWVTIDLSSASDSMSLEMLRRHLPKEVYSFLEMLRSPQMTLPNGDQLELGMISTMGNGYTFPLQTILFLSVVYAAHRVVGYPLERPVGNSLGNYGVYGDDIICRVEVTPQVLRLLTLLGFKVNSDKSFFQGPFRESCGGDYYKGHPVRGVYIDSLRSPQDAYIVVNALNRWTALTGIFLPRTVRLLLKWLKSDPYALKGGRLLFVPLAENDDAGVKVTRQLLRHYVYDRSVQSVQYERFVQRGLHIKFTEDGRVLHPFGSQKAPSKGIIYNPPGLLISFLSGNVSGQGEGVRQSHPRYRTERRITPYWDYIDNAASIALADASVRLGTAISGNTGWS